MKEDKTAACKRPYSLGKRLELSDQKRMRIVAAARALLESDGYFGLTLDVLARESGVTRQTVHNLFGTKAGVLEALFDQIALGAGMDRMRSVMQKADPESMLAGFVDVFSTFWTKDRLLIRRVHGIAAIDPELEAVVQARNLRRKGAATRIVELMDQNDKGRAALKEQRIAALHALTSFEFFDALAESCGSAQEAAQLLPKIVKGALSISRESR